MNAVIMKMFTLYDFRITENMHHQLSVPSHLLFVTNYVSSNSHISRHRIASVTREAAPKGMRTIARGREQVGGDVDFISVFHLIHT